MIRREMMDRCINILGIFSSWIFCSLSTRLRLHQSHIPRLKSISKQTSPTHHQNATPPPHHPRLPPTHPRCSHGCTFLFLLPLTEQPPPHTSKPTKSNHPHRTTKPPISPTPQHPPPQPQAKYPSSPSPTPSRTPPQIQPQVFKTCSLSVLLAVLQPVSLVSTKQPLEFPSHRIKRTSEC